MKLILEYILQLNEHFFLLNKIESIIINLEVVNSIGSGAWTTLGISSQLCYQYCKWFDSWLWWCLPLRLSKRQPMSSQTVLLRTTMTRKIILYSQRRFQQFSDIFTLLNRKLGIIVSMPWYDFKLISRYFYAKHKLLTIIWKLLERNQIGHQQQLFLNGVCYLLRLWVYFTTAKPTIDRRDLSFDWRVWKGKKQNFHFLSEYQLY